MKLNKTTLDRLIYQGSVNQAGKGTQDIRWDDAVPGFGVRVYPSGKKAFVMRYKDAGRTRVRTLGAYGVLTLDEGRNKARRYIGKILEGENPFAETGAIKAKTVIQICEDYIQLYAKPHKKTWKEDKRRLDNNIIPIWKGRTIQSIVNRDVAAFHHEFSKKSPYEANRTVEVLRVLFKLAKQWGYYEGDNPAVGIKKNKEKKRDRWLSADELKRVAVALQAEKNIYAANAIWLYLLTGARKSELLNVKWEQIDWDRKELMLPETKNGSTHYIPLSEPACRLLENLPREEGSPYVFPGKTGPLVNISKAWKRIKKAAEVEDVRLHDLRRTVGSWLAQAGNSLHLIGKVLNHASTQTTAVYARFGQDIVRDALEQHGKRLMVVTGQQEPAEVIQLHGNDEDKKKASVAR